MNKWLGSGKVSEEPTIRYNGDKASFVAFTIMCKRNRRIKEGDQAVDFIDCICVGQNAKLAQDFLRKDKKVEVSGPIQSGHYTAKDGRKVYTKTVFVEELNFAESKAEEEARIQAEKIIKAAQEGKQPEPIGDNPDHSFMDIPENAAGELPFE
mgnify:CR=1 FL=1